METTSCHKESLAKYHAEIVQKEMDKLWDAEICDFCGDARIVQFTK